MVGIDIISCNSSALKHEKRQWFSGKIHRCHRWAPRSIRGWRSSFFALFFTLLFHAVELLPVNFLCLQRRCDDDFGIGLMQFLEVSKVPPKHCVLLPVPWYV